ncbi:MAG TPA: hypothetical protein DIW31_08820, partial [Bacteroidales bacterium]|nr:hypothetical protein [Bacteroidales bacterium]
PAYIVILHVPSTLGGTNKYLFSGKELQDDNIGGVSLNWYFFGARYYMPDLGRWMVIDNKAEKYYSTSQYVYALNNPIKFIDPDGNDVEVSFTDQTHNAALQNLLSTTDGYNFVSRYMSAGSSLTVNGQTYNFSGNGDRANDLLSFRSAEMFDQSHPDNGGVLGDNMTYTKNELFYANDAQSESEVTGGFRQVIRLDKGLSEVDATVTLGHEAFVHADKDADKLTKINEKIKSGGYKNFAEIVKDLGGVVNSETKDHDALKKGEVKKFENSMNELAKKKKNDEYKKKYEEDKNKKR